MAKIYTPIPALKLNDGSSMPMLAFGTGSAWYKNGEESQIDQAIVDSAKAAIKLGYTHLDGAESEQCNPPSLLLTHSWEVYKTEPELGIAIKEGGVPREKLYVVTKVSGSIANIESAIQASLKKLQLDYVDL